MRRTTVLLATTILCGIAAVASAQSYPSKAVSIIVPYPPGGITDITGRHMAAALSERWKQTVVVDNRPGGGTIVGTAAAARAPADGYTVLLTSFGFTTNQILVPDLPYEPSVFAPVTLVGTAPNVLYVHPTVPAQTPKEVVEYARARPKQMLFASSGNASSPHIAAELFASTAGIEMTHVPYKGTSPAMLDLLGGRVHAIFDTMQSMQYVKTGKLRVIAVAHTRRLSTAPELPTFAEHGMPGVVSASWFGFFLPRKAPADVQNRFYADVRRILESGDMREKIVQVGLEPALLTREEFASFLDAELKKWEQVIRSRNIKLDS